MIAWGSGPDDLAVPGSTIAPRPLRSVPRMPATRLPIIGYPLARTALEGVLRTALDEAGSPIQIEQREAPSAPARRRAEGGPRRRRLRRRADRLAAQGEGSSAVGLAERRRALERRGQRPRPHRWAPARLQLRPRRRARRADLDPAAREGSMAAQRGRARRRRRGASGRGGAHRLRLPARRRLQPPPSSRGGLGRPLRPGGSPHGAPGASLARRDHRGRAGSGRGARQRQRDRRRGGRVSDPRGADPAGPIRPRPRPQSVLDRR